MAPPWGHMFYIGLYREKHEKILFKTTRPRALISDVKHHLVNLSQVCSNYIPVPVPGVTLFYIGLYSENMNKSSCLKPYGIEH